MTERTVYVAREMISRVAFLEPRMLDHMMAGMRRKLAFEIMESGYVMIEMPKESITYHAGGEFGWSDPIPQDLINSGYPWDVATVEYRVGVEIPS